MKFLITGATGFIGSKLTEHLLQVGNEVIALGRREEGELPASFLEAPQFTYIQLGSIADALKNEKLQNVDVIVHLASLISAVEWSDYYDTNVVLTQTLFKFACENNISQFIYTSTFSVFGEQAEIAHITESSIPLPESYYGLSKYLVERLLCIESKNKSVQVTVLRFPSVFGRHAKIGLIPLFYSLCQDNKPIDIFSRAEAKRNFLHIDDAVKAICQVVKLKNQLQSYELFCYGSSDSLTIVSVVNLIKNRLDSRSFVQIKPKASSHYDDVFVDIKKAKEKLRLCPMGVEEGVMKYLEEMSHAI